MAVTPISFRVAFPEFASTTTYPDGEVQFWINLAALLHDAARWDTLLDYGIMLFVAHNLSLEYNAKKAAATGQNPGQVMGPLSSGTVDKVSYSRNTAQVMDPKNGHWNLSIYGLRYIQLVNMIGAGPIQVGTGAGEMVAAPWAGVNLAPPW